VTNPLPDRVRAESLRAWLIALRPATLPAAVAPVALGSAVAHACGGFRLGPAAAALAGALLLQILANLSNDLFDYEKGADTEERLGPTRAVQSGLLSPARVRTGVLFTIGLSLIVGLYLTMVAGPAIVAIGIASILAALAYTGGPYPLGYNGLGEVFVIVFFGFVAVCGTAFVQLGRVPLLAWWAALPPGLLASAILVVNNLRDRSTDVRAGKRTLAVRWGRRAAVIEYGALLTAAYLPPMVVTTSGLVGWPALAPLATLPLAYRLVSRVRVEEGRCLNRRLVGTAQLMLGFALLFAGGMVLGPP
jgi:1,4-dihydroxy-2-naphthoate octaprenyltransferase